MLLRLYNDTAPLVDSSKDRFRKIDKSLPAATTSNGVEVDENGDDNDIELDDAKDMDNNIDNDDDDAVDDTGADGGVRLADADNVEGGNENGDEDIVDG